MSSSKILFIEYFVLTILAKARNAEFLQRQLVSEDFYWAAAPGALVLENSLLATEA